MTMTMPSPVDLDALAVPEMLRCVFANRLFDDFFFSLHPPESYAQLDLKTLLQRKEDAFVFLVE